MEEKKQSGKYIFLGLTVVFGLAFIGCVIWLIVFWINIQKEEDLMEDLRKTYVSDGTGRSGTSSQKADDSGPEKPSLETLDLAAAGLAERTIDFAGLQSEQNKDIYAWIFVPGTEIDYPVLQHPDEMDYYLDHNLGGSAGYPGCIYTQRMNAKDWSDFNTILYGHNMKNGTFFAGLHSFKDSGFFQENRYIYIYTEDKRILAYEIFAAYVSGNEHLLMSYDINTDSGKQGYLNSIYTHSGNGCNYLSTRQPTTQDNIITLSTCISGQNTKRYLVQGVLVAEGWQP